eukprot:GSMAST32.ASY1.ANO1.2125.1 assembled CDS
MSLRSALFRTSVRLFSSQKPTVVTPELAKLSLKKLDAAARDHELRYNYENMATEFPPHSTPPEGISPDAAHRKRLIYRSKQRGWLEVDLLLGNYATKYVPSMSLEQMGEYEKILAQETISIFNYVTGKDAPPKELENNSVMDHLKVFAQSNEMRNLEKFQ